MWKCPKCGRTFKNENQSHYCGKTPETVDEYILSQDEAIRGHLERVRNVLRAALPDAVEKISWSMPTWWKGHNIIHFAAAKKHIGRKSCIRRAANTARGQSRSRIPMIFRWI